MTTNNNRIKPRILIITPYFIPGVKGGGPIRSIEGMISNLKEGFDFYIFTPNRDLGDDIPYEGYLFDTWIKQNNYTVYYSSKGNSLRKLSKIINSIAPDKIYLNSFFHFGYSIKFIIMKKMKLINDPIILAPRGEFSEGALSIKNEKKTIFIKVVRLLGLYNGITWHASSKHEKSDIIKKFKGAEVKVATNLSKLSKEVHNHAIKIKGELKLVFISRISRKKNLKFALEVLQNVRGKVSFDIFGPIEDEDYWNECQEVIKDLPLNINVKYNGLIENNEVVKMLSNYDFLFFPTLGENYGHVIRESMTAGTPVIISDQTPWKDLNEKEVGFLIKGFNHQNYNRVINQIIEFDNSKYKNMSINTKVYINEILTNKKAIKANIELFV